MFEEKYKKETIVQSGEPPPVETDIS